MRDRNEGSESNRYQLESKLRDHEGEIQRLQLRVTNYETERQTANEKVKELEGQLKLSESKYMDVREDKEKLSRDLLRAEAIENDLRKSLDQYSRAESTSKHFLNSLLLEKLDNRFPKKDVIKLNYASYTKKSIQKAWSRLTLEQFLDFFCILSTFDLV